MGRKKKVRVVSDAPDQAPVPLDKKPPKSTSAPPPEAAAESAPPAPAAPSEPAQQSPAPGTPLARDPQAQIGSRRVGLTLKQASMQLGVPISMIKQWILSGKHTEMGRRRSDGRYSVHPAWVLQVKRGEIPMPPLLPPKEHKPPEPQPAPPSPPSTPAVQVPAQVPSESGGGTNGSHVPTDRKTTAETLPKPTPVVTEEIPEGDEEAAPPEDTRTVADILSKPRPVVTKKDEEEPMVKRAQTPEQRKIAGLRAPGVYKTKVYQLDPLTREEVYLDEVPEVVDEPWLKQRYPEGGKFTLRYVKDDAVESIYSVTITPVPGYENEYPTPTPGAGYPRGAFSRMTPLGRRMDAGGPFGGAAAAAPAPRDPIVDELARKGMQKVDQPNEGIRMVEIVTDRNRESERERREMLESERKAHREEIQELRRENDTRVQKVETQMEEISAEMDERQKSSIETMKTFFEQMRQRDVEASKMQLDNVTKSNQTQLDSMGKFYAELRAVDADRQTMFNQLIENNNKHMAEMRLITQQSLEEQRKYLQDLHMVRTEAFEKVVAAQASTNPWAVVGTALEKFGSVLSPALQARMQQNQQAAALAGPSAGQLALPAPAPEAAPQQNGGNMVIIDQIKRTPEFVEQVHELQRFIAKSVPPRMFAQQLLAIAAAFGQAGDLLVNYLVTRTLAEILPGVPVDASMVAYLTHPNAEAYWAQTTQIFQSIVETAQQQMQQQAQVPPPAQQAQLPPPANGNGQAPTPPGIKIPEQRPAPGMAAGSFGPPTPPVQPSVTVPPATPIPNMPPARVPGIFVPTPPAVPTAQPIPPAPPAPPGITPQGPPPPRA